MGLPKFSRHQQLRFVGYLRRRKPYREIARIFQNRYPEFVPEGMDQQAYEEAFIKRAKDYVSNRRRKWATIIRIGRRRKYKRGIRALRERIRQLAWEGAFDVHNEQKKELPRFTKEQQRFVVANLIAMTPHRKIARTCRNCSLSLCLKVWINRPMRRRSSNGQRIMCPISDATGITLSQDTESEKEGNSHQ